MDTHSESYYAVIFTSIRTETEDGYSEMAQRMEALARVQDGFLGFESARDMLGITVSYWKSLEAIKQWKANAEHLEAQSMGQSSWYRWYRTRICKVERDYAFGTP